MNNNTTDNIGSFFGKETTSFLFSVLRQAMQGQIQMFVIGTAISYLLEDPTMTSLDLETSCDGAVKHYLRKQIIAGRSGIEGLVDILWETSIHNQISQIINQTVSDVMASNSATNNKLVSTVNSLSLSENTASATFNFNKVPDPANSKNVLDSVNIKNSIGENANA